MVRSLNGLSTGSVRSLNGLNVDTITADLPVLITNRNITLKGLNGLGTAGQIIKVNSGGTELEYANETDTVNTFSSPLVLTGSNVGIGTLNSFGTAGQILTSTATDIVYSNECKLSDIKTTNANLLEGNRFFEYTTASDLITIGNQTDNIVFYNSNLFAISMPIVSGNSTLMTNTSFNTITTLQDTDFILIIDNDGTTLEKITKTNFKTQTGIINPAEYNYFGTSSQTGTRFVGLASQELQLLGQSTIITGKLDQQGALSSGSFNVMGSVLFNTEAPLGSSNGFRSLKLDSTGFTTYGFVNATDFGSDIATYVNNDTVRYSAIGSMTSDCIFGLYSGNAEFLISQPSNRGYCVIGRKAQKINLYTAQVALSVVNDTDNLDYNDARFRVESLADTHDPVIEIVSNSGVNSGTKYFSYLYNDKPGNLNIVSIFTINIGSPLKTIKTNQFTSIGTGYTTGNQIAVEYHYLRDPQSAFSHIWRNQIGTGGDLHYDYRANGTSGSWIPNAYVSNGRGYYSIMNFTGKHRCIPEEEELYDNIDNYIGMVVETTGQYNSIDYINTEEEEIAEDKVEAYKDIKTKIYYPEKINYVKLKRKSQKTFSNPNPTIDEAQPIIRLSSKLKSKTVYGVISSREINDNGKRTFSVGTFSSIVGELQDNRLVINSIGEGALIVNGEMGNIENGDLLMSSSTTGIACKQDDDIVRNYTIGKATQDYNFTGNENKLIGCVYYCG